MKNVDTDMSVRRVQYSCSNKEKQIERKSAGVIDNERNAVFHECISFPTFQEL